MPFVDAAGVTLHYEVHGAGPRLLFISGSGSDLRNRPNVFDGPLPDHFEVLCYDQRGLGQSDKPHAEYTMTHYADDAAALLDALRWERVPVMGVSFGGMVAQELALCHPHRVAALVLACTSAGGAGGASFPLHELARLTPEARRERHLELSDLRRTHEWRAANPQRWSKLLDVARARESPHVDAAGAVRQLAARAGHDTWDRLPQLRLPVLIAGGRHDGIAPVANQQALARRIAGAELRLYAGGHLFLVQDKSAYPEVIEWLEAHG